MITKDSPIIYNRKDTTNQDLILLYKGILKPRMIEEKMMILLRQGKLAKWFSGIGQEAGSVGVAMGMSQDEFILPMHRNLGVFTSRNIPLSRLFAQFLGKSSGFTNGRDRSFHFGTHDYNIVGMISHLGPQMGVADGIALSNLLSQNKRMTAVFTGDGGASEGDFHESINVAAVWGLPLLIVVENNGYGLSTPSNEQFKCRQFIDKAIGYGIEGIQVDGNNVLEVYQTVKALAQAIRSNPRPILLELITFRMRGHEEASGTKYVPKELMETWSKKDPLVNFEQYLIAENVISPADIAQFREAIKAEIDQGLEIALGEPLPQINTQKEVADLFAEHHYTPQHPATSSKTNKRFIDAISDGLALAMEKHPNLVLMGQDIADYGGVFKITDGFVARFGKERVRNTPLCESAILGTGFGLSIAGYKAMVEMQFADFVSEGMTQIINNYAKSHYRWGQHADVVVRMPTGAAVGAGPFHSQSNEAWFIHTPGLRVVYPAFPIDAKGLLLAAFEDPNPVMFFEHKALYRSVSQDVPDEYYTIEIGKANIVIEGDDLTIVTYGLGVHWAIEALKAHPEINAELIDLRTLSPLDLDSILTSVKKTGKVIILHEDTLTGGIGGEIAALIAEHCFKYLAAQIMRSASLDTPVPMNEGLEWNFLPKTRFEKQLIELYQY